MADDAQWIDEAAEQQAAPQDERPSPDKPVTADPSMMERLYQFINRNVFPKQPPQQPWQAGDQEPYFNKGPMARPPLVPDNYAPETRDGAIAQPVPMPQPRPADADNPAAQHEAAWNRMSPAEQTSKRAEQLKLYRQIMGPENVPLPRARPADADAKAYDENRGWDVLTERQKQMIRAKQIQQYNQIMKGRR